MLGVQVFAGPAGPQCDATEWYAMQVRVTSGVVDKYITTTAIDTNNVLSPISLPYVSKKVHAEANQELVSGCLVTEEFDGTTECMCPEFLCPK